MPFKYMQLNWLCNFCIMELLRHIGPSLNFVMLRYFVESQRASCVDVYVAINYCAHLYIDMAYIGDISNPSHIVLRFIRSHIASGVDARAICWELHFDNALACCFTMHSHFLMYHLLLGDREMGISHV